MSNLILYQSKKHVYKTLMVPCEKSKMVSFASSVTKKIVAFAGLSKFPVKLIYCIALGSVLSVFCLLNSCAVNLYCYLKKW